MPNDIAVYGIDFTSRPGTRKRITCLECRLVGDSLHPVEMHRWDRWENFQEFLTTPPEGQPWISAMDFPFGLPLRFLENNGWPISWPHYMDQMIGPMSRECWRTTGTTGIRGTKNTGGRLIKSLAQSALRNCTEFLWRSCFTKVPGG